MNYFAIFLTLAVFGWASSERSIPRRPKYEFFDDYLVSITADAPTAHNEVLDKADETQGHPRDTQVPAEEPANPTTTTTTAASTTVAPEEDPTSRDILGYFRDVPRRHWSCCMLGKLAGDKGFHCDANFYATRITRRNRNRAHNRRMNFQGQDAIPNWGLSIMTTFERCIARHSAEFHKCCYAATIERREIDRWHYYRLSTDGTEVVASGQHQTQHQTQQHHQRRSHDRS